MPEPTTEAETVNGKLDEIAEVGSGTLKTRPASGAFRVHLTVRGVSETTFTRIFDTSLFGEQPTAAERVIVQTRGKKGAEWSTPQVHYRNGDGLTGPTDDEVIV